MRIPRIIWTTLTLILSATSLAQDISSETAKPLRWDSVHGVAFFGTGVIRASQPPLRAYSYEGNKLGPDIDVFKDFSGLEHAIIDDAALGPNNSIVIAGILNFGKKQIRHVILTYSDAGKLKQVLDTEPYYAVAISVDDHGTIYSLANRLDVKPQTKTYPLLLAYSSDGRLLQEGLVSSALRFGDDSINLGIDYSQAILTIVGDRLMFYAPRSREIVTCTLRGDVLSVTDISSALQKAANEDRASRITVEGITLAPGRAVIALYETPKTGASILTIRIVNLAKLESKTLHSASGRKWQLLGFYKDEYVVLERGGPTLALKGFNVVKDGD